MFVEFKAAEEGYRDISIYFYIYKKKYQGLTLRTVYGSAQIYSLTLCTLIAKGAVARAL